MSTDIFMKISRNAEDDAEVQLSFDLSYHYGWYLMYVKPTNHDDWMLERELEGSCPMLYWQYVQHPENFEQKHISVNFSPLYIEENLPSLFLMEKFIDDNLTDWDFPEDKLEYIDDALINKYSKMFYWKRELRSFMESYKGCHCFFFFD